MEISKVIALLSALGDSTQAPTSASEPWKVGQCYMIRTVTMTWTGRVIWVGPQEIVLEDAAWIAHTGVFHKATCEENLQEVEPVQGTVNIGRYSVVDSRVWTSPLPRKAK